MPFRDMFNPGLGYLLARLVRWQIFFCSSVIDTKFSCADNEINIIDQTSAGNGRNLNSLQIYLHKQEDDK